jgi:hypothetical protein
MSSLGSGASASAGGARAEERGTEEPRAEELEFRPEEVGRRSWNAGQRRSAGGARAEELERRPEEVGAEELQDGDALGLGAEEGAPPGARRSTSSNRHRHATGTLDPMGWS